MRNTFLFPCHCFSLRLRVSASPRLCEKYFYLFFAICYLTLRLSCIYFYILRVLKLCYYYQQNCELNILNETKNTSFINYPDNIYIYFP